MDIHELFELGMKRELPRLLPAGPVALNLGADKQNIHGAFPLDYPEWNAETDAIPCPDGSVDTIYAFHFLEHLSGVHVIRMLRECQRVLKVGGTLNVVVPHHLGSMAYHDLDHKTFWTEDQFKTLFSTPYYDKNREEPWLFDIGLNVIIGIVQRNLAVMTQLVRK